MNSYFTNPSLPCHLGGGQDVLPNVALNSGAYDAVRHFPSYGAAVAQNRLYSAPFYQENAVVFGSGRAPYEYGSNAFYQDKEALSSCRQGAAGAHGSPGAAGVGQEFPSEQSRGAPGHEHKGSIQIYPWMQRMNSHSGESAPAFGRLLVSPSFGLFIYYFFFKFYFT